MSTDVYNQLNQDIIYNMSYYKVEPWVLKDAVDNLDKAVAALDKVGKGKSVLSHRCKKISKLIRENYPAVNDTEHTKTKR